MALTKKQKVYGSVLMTAVVAFGWDYLSTGDKPAPAATDLLVHVTAAPQLGGGSPAPPPAATLPRSAIALRLRRVAAVEHLDPENVNSAFALGPGWLPERPTGPVATAAKADTIPPVEPAKDFARRHRLDAVMVRQRGGYAIVDGVGVFVGQQCERFRLASVTQNSAIFVWNNEKVELKIVRPDELMKDGSVISSRNGAMGGEAAVDGKAVIQP